MSGLGALSKIIAARVPRAEPWVGVRPETLRLIELQTHDPFGAPLGRDVAREEELKRLLQSATPVLRRKSIADLLNGKLQSVHESGHTGAAAGAKRVTEMRHQSEPRLFGEKGQSYGLLTSDPYRLAQVTEKYPVDGAVIQADYYPQQYGRYGLVPHDKFDRATFTLGDHLDDSKAGALSPYFLHGPMTELERPHAPNWFGSAAWELSDDVVNRSREATNGLSRHKTKKIRSAYEDEYRETLAKLGAGGPDSRSSGPFTVENSRLLPRRLDDPFVVPMTPGEWTNSRRASKNIASPDYDYVEYQMHGDVTPDRIAKVLDYGIAPSASIEKKLRKLGVDYEPVVEPNSLLAQFVELKKRDAELSEWLAAMEARKGEASNYLLKALPRWEQFPEEFRKLRVADHYAHGGLVQ